MSAFPESGRSGTAKTTEMKGRFRPKAEIDQKFQYLTYGDFLKLYRENLSAVI